MDIVVTSNVLLKRKLIIITTPTTITIQIIIGLIISVDQSQPIIFGVRSTYTSLGVHKMSLKD